MEWVYSYDLTTKLPTQTILTNGDGNHTTYSYSYDGYKRLSTTIEDNPYATFTNSFTYDTYGLLGTETYQAIDKESGATAQTSLSNFYDGRLLSSINLTNPINMNVWHAMGVDERGNINDYGQNNTTWTYIEHDTYGYPQNTYVDRTGSSSANVMTLGYSFNAPRGFPTSRSNSVFSWNESFSYDNLDRLTIFNDNNGTHSQQYDLRGRITSNSRLGDYNYTGTSYQQDDLDLNTVADAYYQTREQQLITFNAFKSPVEIHEPGHDRYSFQYNGILQRANVFHGSEDANQLLRPYRKHYSADGKVEISKDLVTGTTDFVFFLGGDAYSAPAIWKKTHSSSLVDSAIYFLHRDYLGSIVLITNASGYPVEQRQFDAWGNIVKLTDGSNNNLTNFTVTPRGYTGHEHLLPVGLIHMNARLYDPLLGRFLSPDNFVQGEFGTQAFNRYGYAQNNPMVYVDENGEFIFSLFLPGIGTIIDGILWGAAIGAGTSAAVYSVNAAITGNWNWSDLGNAVAMGAVGGALGGGFGALGSLGTLGSFGNSFGYNLLSQGANMGLTNVMFGNEITWGSLAGVAAGGLAGAFLPHFNAVKGGAFKNAVAELGFNTARGAATGFVSGLAQWGLGGEKSNLWQSTLGGIAGGAGSTLFNLAIFGSAIQFDDTFIPHGSDRPIHREGGLSSLLGGTGISWGRTAYVNSRTGSSGDRIHESYHYLQQKQLGFANFYGRTFQEYVRALALTGDWQNVYRTIGTLEYEAMIIQRSYENRRH